MKGRQHINDRIKDEKRPDFSSSGNFFVTCHKQRLDLCLLKTHVKELFPVPPPALVRRNAGLKTGRTVRDMITDEVMVVLIPIRGKEPSSDTPDVCEILGR
jgi:hypothetical protein